MCSLTVEMYCRYQVLPKTDAGQKHQLFYLSVKSACAAVATLHQTEIKGNLVWARQLGGGGEHYLRLTD